MPFTIGAAAPWTIPRNNPRNRFHGLLVVVPVGVLCWSNVLCKLVYISSERPANVFMDHGSEHTSVSAPQSQDISRGFTSIQRGVPVSRTDGLSQVKFESFKLLFSSIVAPSSPYSRFAEGRLERWVDPPSPHNHLGGLQLPWFPALESSLVYAWPGAARIFRRVSFTRICHP